MKNIFLLITLILLFGCGNKSEVVKESVDLPDNFIPNELIVQLKAGVLPEVLENKFKAQAFTLKEEISVHMRAYLFSFDDEIIEPTKMLNLVKSLDEVSSAEFNKDLNLRN